MCHRLGALVAALLLFPATADAIDFHSAGVSAGGSWMTQSWDYDGTDLEIVDSGIFGPSLGGFAIMSVTPAFHVGLETFYLRKGFETEFTKTSPDSPNPQGTFTETYELHYLSVPVTARYRIPAGSVVLYPLGGVSAEILLGRSDNWLLDELNSVVFALHLGAGVDIGRFAVTARYVGDFTNSYDRPSSADEDGITLESVKSQGVAVLVSYSLWQ